MPRIALDIGHGYQSSTWRGASAGSVHERDLVWRYAGTAMRLLGDAGVEVLTLADGSPGRRAEAARIYGACLTVVCHVDAAQPSGPYGSVFHRWDAGPAARRLATRIGEALATLPVGRVNVDPCASKAIPDVPPVGDPRRREWERGCLWPAGCWSVLSGYRPLEAAVLLEPLSVDHVGHAVLRSEIEEVGVILSRAILAYLETP